MFEELRKKAAELKAAAKDAGVSCVVVMIDDDRNRSVARSIFANHHVQMRAVICDMADKVRLDPEPQKIEVDRDRDTGYVAFSIGSKRVLGYQQKGGSHYLMVPECETKTFEDASDVRDFIVTTLRDAGGDVGRMLMDKDAGFEMPL
jgi:hypothetical protein